MFDLDWSHVIHRARGVGKTYQMVQAAKAIGGALVCTNARHAKQLREDYPGLETLSVTDALRVRGTTYPVLFEPESVAEICHTYETENQVLRKNLRDAERKLEAIRKAVQDG